MMCRFVGIKAAAVHNRAFIVASLSQRPFQLDLHQWRAP